MSNMHILRNRTIDLAWLMIIVYLQFHINSINIGLKVYMSKTIKYITLFLFSLCLLSCTTVEEKTKKQTLVKPTKIVLEIDTEEMAKRGIEENGAHGNIIDKACVILEHRLKALNYSPVKVTRQKDNTILLELPKPLNAESQSVILSTERLEFYPVTTEFSSSYTALLASIDSVLSVSQTYKTLSLSSLYRNEAFPESERENIIAILNRDDVKAFLKDSKLIWGASPITNRYGEVLTPKYYNLYHVPATPAMTGDKIVTATDTRNPEFGSLSISIQFNSAGAREFADVTNRYKHKMLAIVIGDKVHSAPRIQQKISSGEAEISGNFTEEEARNLAVILMSGRNILPLKVASITHL